MDGHVTGALRGIPDHSADYLKAEYPALSCDGAITGPEIHDARATSRPLQIARFSSWHELINPRGETLAISTHINF